MSDPMIAKLEPFDPLPKRTPTWPFPGRVANDPDLCREMTRVLGCGSTSLRWATSEQLQQIVDADPKLICLVWGGMYKHKWEWAGVKYPKWTKEEVCGPEKAEDTNYLAFFYAKCLDAKKLIGGIPVMVIFDFEVGCGDRPHVGDKLNKFYKLAKYVFGEDTRVIYYNHNQWVGSPARKSSPVPSNTLGDMANCSLYYDAYSVTNRDTLGATAWNNINKGPIAAWVSIGGCYEQYPWITPTRTRKDRSLDVIQETEPGSDYHAADLLYHDPRVELVILWPEVFSRPYAPWKHSPDEHFLAFVEGAHKVKR